MTDLAVPEPWSDEELGALVVAADPDVEPDADARPLSQVLGDETEPPLPAWYMPAPMARAGVLRGWRRTIVFIVISAFLTITAYGLCNTYDQLHLP